MGSAKWTAAQQAAIEYHGRNLLLSASAGSGKTATLTERIIQLLTDPGESAEISRILCVTFTRAAAAELRERIGRALRSAIAKDRTNTRLTRQLYDLGRAQITTIHSFCLRVLRSHAAELELPAGFSVMSEADVHTVSRQTMTDVLSACFDAGEPWFLTLADTLGGARDEASLDDVLLTLADSLASRGMDGASLATLADRMTAGADSFFTSPGGAGTRTRVLRMAEHYGSYFSAASAQFSQDKTFARAYLEGAQACLSLAQSLAAACMRGDYGEARQAILDFQPPARLGIVKKEMQTEDVLYFKEMYAAFKKEIATLQEKSFALTEEQVSLALVRTADICRAAARVLELYFSEMRERKRERGAVDFGDLELLCARLFCDAEGNPTDAARETGAAFDYIFIDEYQDTNRTQDAIFTALASGGGSRFMVGDIKQSIYRFRGAEPDVFAAYRRAWHPLPEGGVTEDITAEDGYSIFMRENFRCDRTVVDFVNLVSRYMFSFGGIPFTSEDELAYAKVQPEEYRAHPVQVRLLPAEGEDGGNEPVTEAEYVARRISHMLERERRADGTPYSPSDIAILLRSPGADGAAFAEALQRRGIRVRNRAARSLYEEPEVVLVLSILRAIDNPGRDIDLAGAMKNPVFRFTLDDLIRIRRAYPDGSLWDAVRRTSDMPHSGDPEEAGEDGGLSARCAEFCARLNALRAGSRGMGADKLILRLYDETDMQAIAEADESRDPGAVRANLRALYEVARQFENESGGGLYPFLIRIENEVNEGGAAEEESNSAEEVHIYSIHQSKGLEFPVCFLARTAKRRNARDTASFVLFDPSVGAAMRLPDEGGLVLCDTPLRRSVACSMNDAAVEEEMRVLYVAMTRARERLIITATVADPENELQKRVFAAQYYTAHTVYSTDNYISWILDAIASEKLHGGDTSFVDVALAEDLPDCRASHPPVCDADSAVQESADEAEITRWTETFSKRFAYVYPYAHLAEVPAKLTVSKLYPGILDEDGEDVRTEISRAPTRADCSERNRAPRFLAGETEFEASFAGTATHVFLQFCDFRRLTDQGTVSELARLRAEGFLSDAMSDAVRIEEIEKFRQSKLFARMCRARSIRREFRFNAALPAADFTRDEALRQKLRDSSTDVIVQGVVDCLFTDEEGRIVLVDYKTDRLTKAERDNPLLAAEKLIPRHKNQLRYYRAVCAAMLGTAVDECHIYSLPLGDSILVPEEETGAEI